jgi:hypothetical protein
VAFAVRFTPVRFAPVRFAPARLVPARFAVVRFAVVRFAVVRLVARFAVVRFAVVRLARRVVRLAVARFAVERLARRVPRFAVVRLVVRLRPPTARRTAPEALVCSRATVLSKSASRFSSSLIGSALIKPCTAFKRSPPVAAEARRPAAVLARLTVRLTVPVVPPLRRLVLAI